MNDLHITDRVILAGGKLSCTFEQFIEAMTTLIDAAIENEKWIQSQMEN
jgi:hypothetical protein